MRLSKSQAVTADAHDTQVDAATVQESANVMGILDSIDVPIVVVGRDCNITRFNHAASAALGLAQLDIGSALTDVRALLEATDLLKQCQQVIADGAPCRRELRIGDRWFLIHIAPNTGIDHLVTGAVITFTNVTGFRASIGQAVYEREYTKAILNTVIDPLVVLDADLRIQTGNRAFYEMFGVSREETQGTPLASLGNPEWKASDLWASLRAILSGRSEAPSREVDRDFPAIGCRTLRVDARRLSRDGDTKILVTFQDITERKRAEDALKESEWRFRKMVDVLPAAIYTTDAEGRLTHFNPACVELSGRSPQIGTDHWCVTSKLYFPDGTPMPLEECPMAIALKEGHIIRGTEAIAERPDGTRVWFMPYPTPMRNAEGEIIGGINMLLDITERKKAEEDIRQSKEALTQADKRKDEFLATLAHELRGPLAPVRNMLEVLKRAEGDGKLVHEAIPMMDRQLVQMTRLIDDLLDLSRISRGRIELKREQIELTPILHHAIEASRPLAECAEHEVIVQLPQEHIYLDGDPVRLAQIFSNLLNNSCKYTPARGKIWLTAVRDGANVTVKVKDTGVGIPASKLAGVFEMFAQLDQSLERAQGGLGIGLTLVKRLVEMHGGTVTAHSDGAGRGSEFTIDLPTLKEPAFVQSPEPVKEAVKSRRILVVDDNRDSAMSLAMLLKMTGNDTQLAHDGSEAVETAGAYRPDLILLDIGLPKMNGYDACRAIRKEPWGKNIVLVALSGWGQAEDRRKSQEAGFDLHLVKPVDYAVLSSFLTKLDAAPT